MENRKKNGFLWLDSSSGDGWSLCTDMDTEQLVTPCIWLCIQRQNYTDWHTLHTITIGLTNFLDQQLKSSVLARPCCSSVVLTRLVSCELVNINNAHGLPSSSHRESRCHSIDTSGTSTPVPTMIGIPTERRRLWKYFAFIPLLMSRALNPFLL